jgi:hypothetical protein
MTNVRFVGSHILETVQFHLKGSSMMKVALGGLVGGVVMFLWGAVSHMLLPTGHMGLRPLPNEEALAVQRKVTLQTRADSIEVDAAS